MKIKFYLKRPKAKSETSIYALVNYEGKSLKVYIGEKILPKYWNAGANAARNTPKFAEHPEFNERLTKIRSSINRAFLDYRNKNDHSSPSPAVLKPLIEAALKKGNIKTSFLDYFDDFVNRTFAGQRINPRSKQSIRYGVAKGYKTTLNYLKRFAKVWTRTLDFETIDLDFHADFTKYLSSPPLSLSVNSIGTSFKRIKAVLAEATEKKVNTNLSFKSKYFIKQAEDADTIYLTEAELDEMRSLDLSQEPRLDNVRDLFLIASYTGLRHGDVSKLRPENIVDGFIRITQSKTGEPVTIPVRQVVKEILEKHNGNIPQPISNVKMNLYLKEIGQKMKSLDKIETKSITKGGTKITTTHKKWELLQSHTARRSFCSNEYKAGILDTIKIRAISGHRSEEAFLKYIRVTLEEQATKVKELWDERDRKTNLEIA